MTYHFQAEAYDETDREGPPPERYCMSCMKTGYHSSGCPDEPVEGDSDEPACDP
jgi:hypothetical protein